MSYLESMPELISSIDWSNFVNARSHHGNVDLQTVGRSQLADVRVREADFQISLNHHHSSPVISVCSCSSKGTKLSSRRHPPQIHAPIDSILHNSRRASSKGTGSRRIAGHGGIGTYICELSMP